MSKFKTTLALFLAGLPFSSGKASVAEAPRDVALLKDDPGPVSLQALNRPGDNLFAGHRSHSSHRSHRSHSSHYSGASGGSSYTPTPSYSPPPPPPPPSYTAPAPTPIVSNAAEQNSADKASAVPEVPKASKTKPALNRAEKLKLQIMRVQIALTTLSLYKGPISGELDEATKESLVLFQRLKSLPETGLMSSDTLNALGVPAVK